MVVAATLWSVWLARNELVFSKVKIKKKALAKLIQLRVSKWGKASGLLDFGETPLWKIHPQGAIALHNHKVSKSFWLHKRSGFDLVCAVDGAWGPVRKSMGGGVGGTIHNNRGSLLLSFSGPVHSKNPILTEIAGVLFVIQCLRNHRFKAFKSVICSSSVTVVNACLLYTSPSPRDRG